MRMSHPRTWNPIWEAVISHCLKQLSKIRGNMKQRKLLNRYCKSRSCKDNVDYFSQRAAVSLGAVTCALRALHACRLCDSVGRAAELNQSKAGTKGWFKSNSFGESLQMVAKSRVETKGFWLFMFCRVCFGFSWEVRTGQVRCVPSKSGLRCVFRADQRQPVCHFWT